MVFSEKKIMDTYKITLKNLNLSDMQPGQFLVNKDGEKREILEVFKNTVIYERNVEIINFFPDRKKEFTSIIKIEIETIKKLKEEGWSLLEEPWVPEEDDNYFYVTAEGGIEEGVWDGGEEDRFRWKIGNIHRTKADAEKYKQKLIETMGRKEK